MRRAVAGAGVSAIPLSLDIRFLLAHPAAKERGRGNVGQTLRRADAGNNRTDESKGDRRDLLRQPHRLSSERCSTAAYPYKLYLKSNGINHGSIEVKTPKTNGIVKRMAPRSMDSSASNLNSQPNFSLGNANLQFNRNTLTQRQRNRQQAIPYGQAMVPSIAWS